MTPAPVRKHQAISGYIFGEIFLYLKKKTCKVYSAPFDVRLSKNGKTADDRIYTVVQPDIRLLAIKKN